MPTVETNDIETYYQRRGSGPPIVFVHGAIVDHTQWTPQFDALAADYTTIAYDVRGHGRTGGSPREAYSIELFADDLDALVTALDIEKPVLCGLSLGGCIAQVYAARHPEKISGLVFADTFTPALSTFAERLQLAVLQSAVYPVRLVGYERVQAVMTWVHERLNSGSSGDYDTIQRLQAEMPEMSTAEFTKVIRAIGTYRETAVDYTAISVPTLVLYGENVPGFLSRQATLLADAISDASLREVPNGGHASNIDNPGFVTDAIRELLDAVESGGGDDRRLSESSGERSDHVWG